MEDTRLLNNGMAIPTIGYGTPIVLTYRNHDDYSKSRIMKYWFKNWLYNKRQYKLDRSINDIFDSLESSGFHLIDTSRAYGGSEYCIGKMLKKHGRDNFKVITKLRNKDQNDGNVREGLMRSLKELQLDSVDLYLMHWPVEEHYVSTWKEMEQLYREGYCKAIGVCNCNIHHLESIMKCAKVIPTVNQFECHPLLTQNELRVFCNEHQIQVMAYTSTARMDERLMKTCLPEIGEKYGKSVAQVILRWHVQLGNIPLVNSSNVEHLKQNCDIFNFSLTEEEMDRILAININSRLRYDPDNCDFTKL